MQTKYLYRVAEYEKNLRDIPFENLLVEYDGYSDYVYFINNETGERYKGQLFDQRTGYRQDWTSAFVFTVIGEKVNYYLKHEKVKNIIKNYINMSFMMTNKKFRFFLRVDSDNEVFGVVSNYFNFTDKLDIHKFIIEAISIENSIQENDIRINERIVKYGKIFVDYLVQDKCKLSIEYGYDNGFSSYNIYHYEDNVAVVMVNEWRHNQDIRILFDLILDSITKKKRVLKTF